MGQPGPHQPRLIQTAVTDNGALSIQVREGVETQTYILDINGGASNPVQVTVTPDAIAIQLNVGGVLHSFVRLRKDGSVAG